MRMTDLLQTETPRPFLGDPVFTDFTNLCPDPTVIDGTDVYTLFMEMTLDGEATKTEEQRIEAEMFEDALGTAGWQMAQFFQFDFSSLGIVAPPFDNFVIEFDLHKATMDALRARGGNPQPADYMHLGQYACAFSVLRREVWKEQVAVGAKYARSLASGTTLEDIDALDFRWMYCLSTFRLAPGKPLAGPTATWLVPVSPEGRLYMAESQSPKAKRPTLLAAAALGPRARDWDEDSLSDQFAITQGWQVVIPALLSLSFLHTPRTDKKHEGYHDLVAAPEPPARLARKYLQRHFRPMVKWVTLDISPLRRAVREANGGAMPGDFAALHKALHVVRGYTRTYMPNTYFGRKHDRPITVFTPSHKRGDVKQGVVQKEYRLDTTDDTPKENHG